MHPLKSVKQVLAYFPYEQLRIIEHYSYLVSSMPRNLTRGLEAELNEMAGKQCDPSFAATSLNVKLV